MVGAGYGVSKTDVGDPALFDDEGEAEGEAGGVETAEPALDDPGAPGVVDIESIGFEVESTPGPDPELLGGAAIDVEILGMTPELDCGRAVVEGVLLGLISAARMTPSDMPVHPSGGTPSNTISMVDPETQKIARPPTNASFNHASVLSRLMRN